MRQLSAAKSPRIKQLVDEHLLVTVEKGIAGGYIATIGDVDGKECSTVYSALRSARDAIKSSNSVV